jgi:rhodanese-related sulfurtransferase
MQNITIQELKARIEANEELNLIDVRQPEENAEFNIGGLLLPLGNIVAMQIDDIEDLKNQEVICYCRAGQRSMQACVILESLGFTDVKSLSGGMMAWQSEQGL